MKAPAISLQRIYEGTGPDEAYKALVDRMWPRGLRRADLAWTSGRATSPRPPNCANGSATSTSAGTSSASATTRNWPRPSSRPA